MTYARLVDGGADAAAAAVDGTIEGIIAATSGSTGEPRDVLIRADAVAAGARAALERLGGPGNWLLALPEDRIAGAMVAARARAGEGILTRMARGSFTPQAFAAAVTRMPQGRRYVSLVPTQVRRLVGDPAGADALATFDAVLVGGAPPGATLPANAVETYGMTETCGGCVYDGMPLAGVDVAVGADGRISLAGPMLAEGYADGSDPSFTEIGGTRWFTTSDLGAWDGTRLTVHGRVDDVIISGGANVHPATVERALLAHPGVADAVAVGVPHAEWGEAVVALVAPASGTVLETEVLRLGLDLPRHARPRIVLAVDAIPRTPAGKIDRSAARAIAARAAEEAP
ncbi:AMP-binding enzyme [uncultured Demequina sp.]|uniref:AMP-binding enzyme n=1 Tax=uncultured Demequina sp. TaxID=693499 RepID=UPI0025F13929|nr:AMP-binding protein [uncultured Demequina sp.]